jgi:hypothetical protein
MGTSRFGSMQLQGGASYSPPTMLSTEEADNVTIVVTAGA